MPLMKLNILSDLHLSQGALPQPETNADVVILAGDIARPAEAIAWASGFRVPVVYVAGNHEFYGSTFDATIAALKRLAAGTCVQVLDDEEAVLGGVRFLGSTLWTDFGVTGKGAAQALAMREAALRIRDFSVIRTDATAPFTPAAAIERFDRHAAWLEERLDETRLGPTVVITHHAPSPRSIHPRFAGSPVNACFVSDVERLLDGASVRLWIHGHTHDSFDYVVNGTRVVCNPRGYAKGGVNENPRFDPDFVVELE
jgi:predicted phosphodiesterase